MKKRKARRRSSSHRASRRRRTARNPRVMFLAAPKRKGSRRHRYVARRSRRHRNPGMISNFASGGMLKMIGGAAAGFLGSNALPALIPQLAPYNAGFSGYAIQGIAGLAISWAAKRFFGPQAGMGALVGTGLALVLRAVKDHAASTGSATSAAMSGDLAYYGDDRFPYPQGSGGPYGTFPGNPSLANPPFPATSAAAVRAGQAAAAAALPAPAMHGIATGRWGVATDGTASRWN